MKWPLISTYFSKSVICIRILGYGIKITKQPLNFYEKFEKVKYYKITKDWLLIFLHR